MEKNKLYSVSLFTLIVIAGVFLLSLVPAFKLSDFESKKVDIFGDIRPDDSDSIQEVEIIDTMSIKLSTLADTCKEGMVCIEDYTAERSALNNFYDALLQNNRPVRIAYFGDSFIEGDILTSSLRELFQSKYGGNGVGFVPINTITSGFRTTVKTSAHGWHEYCVTDSACVRSKQGISGHYFIPNSGANASFVCRINGGKQNDTCSIASFYFITEGNLKFTTTVNKTINQKHSIEGSSEIQKISVEGEIENIKITIDNPGKNTRFFGVSMDNDKVGVELDNFSLRGSSGTNLKGITEQTLSDFNKLRNYDLVVLQYGLNVAAKSNVKYDYYKKGMVEVISHLRKNFPETNFLLVSVGDRATKTNGKMTTMQGVKSLSVTQKLIAAECDIAFWNLLDAMALDGGIVGYVTSKPSKANQDYTHINFRGGEQIAKHLFDALEHGKEKYAEKKKYDIIMSRLNIK